mgnify:CR=1 FL=1
MSMTYDLVIRGGTLVTHDGIGVGDVGVKDGRIVTVGQLADACALPNDLTGFDAVLMANLLCRLPDPQACLAQLSGPQAIVKPGGLAVIISPYTWMKEHTPPERWLGGYEGSGGERVYSNATLAGLLDELGIFDAVTGDEGGLDAAVAQLLHERRGFGVVAAEERCEDILRIHAA